VWGWWGHIIDILAVFATLFGLATSLGFGTEQAQCRPQLPVRNLDRCRREGVADCGNYRAGADLGLRGLDGGVKVLSEINMPWRRCCCCSSSSSVQRAPSLKRFFSGGVAYVKELIPLSMPFGREDANFASGLDCLLLGLVDLLVTVRRHVHRPRLAGPHGPRVRVLRADHSDHRVRSVDGAFGGTAIAQVMADAAAPVIDAALELKLFEMLKPLPLAGLTSFIGIVLVLVFFVTSSDSGSLVIDTITAGGKTDAPVAQRVFWCTFEGVVAATLLLVGGATALTALQAMAVSTGFPFTIVLLAMCVSLFIGLRQTQKENYS
jgi:BCCT family betaine/carnitine transporter